MSTPLAVRVDGEPTRLLDALDRGLHYGDGLFETIACRTAQPRFLDLHLERLAQGCARLAIALPDLAQLAAQIRALAATRPDCIIKVIVTRGSATARGYGAGGDERSRTVLLQYEWPPEDPACWRHGVAVRTARGRLGENPALAGLKHLNRLEQVLIRGEWTDPAIAEALVFSSSGWLVSGTMSNVFLVREGRIMTPAISAAGVRGVMRRVVMREAQRAGFDTLETTLDAAALTAAEELFLTNARWGIWPVRSLDGAARAVGPVTRQLQHALLPLLESPHA
jgi:4-amino-4-deoxychorismate lyase